MLLAASVWPDGIACSAPRTISPICAPQKIESAKIPACIAEKWMPTTAST